MPFHKLQQMGSTSAGVALPKTELRAEGCLDEEGESEGATISC